MPFVCCRSNPTFPSESASSTQYIELKVECLLKRRSSYYMWNIVFIDFALVLTSFSVLLIPASELADRMSISLTLLLTAVAFKFVVSEKLPSISYLTLLDGYVLCGFAMQVFVVLENAIAHTLTEESSNYADRVGALLLLAYFACYHVVYLVKTYGAARAAESAIDRYIPRMQKAAPPDDAERWWARVHRQEWLVAGASVTRCSKAKALL